MTGTQLSYLFLWISFINNEVIVIAESELTMRLIIYICHVRSMSLGYLYRKGQIKTINKWESNWKWNESGGAGNCMANMDSQYLS